MKHRPEVLKATNALLLQCKSVREVFENEKSRTDKFLVLDSRDLEKSRSDM